MSSFRIRPRFELESPFSHEELQERFTKSLESHSAYRGTVMPHFVVVKIPPEERHFWSPQLSLSLEEHPNGVLIRGLYGPNPSVWTMFTFGYSLLGFLAMIVSIIGFSQMNLGLDSSILWLLPVLVLLAIGLYVMAQLGQKLGAEHMFRLHYYLEETLGISTPIH